MKSYPARFVGEIRYVDAYGPSAPPHRVGDVRRTDEFVADMPAPSEAVARTFRHGPYLAIDCACGSRHLVALAPYAFDNGASWTLTSTEPVNFEPSVFTHEYDNGHCHFFVHGGELQMLDDTTAVLKDA